MNNSLSKIIVQGNLTRDAELKVSPNGVSVVNFGIAVNGEWRNKAGEKQKEVNFFNCVMFTDKLVQYLTKGKPVIVSGVPTNSEWTDRDGNKKTTFKIQVENIYFLPDGNRSQRDQNHIEETGEPAQYENDRVPF